MMKTSYLYAFIALFAIALVFGCISNTSNQTNKTTGELTVTPTQVVGGGPVTIQYMLTNNYENNMKNTTVSLLGVPSSYSPPDPITAGIVMPDQQYPIIFQITAPNVGVKQTVTPKIQVCYDYDTNYYFDTVLKTTAIATETAPTESGYSTGPISVTQMGLDSVFTDTGTGSVSHTGSMQITNTGNGKIIRFNQLAINSSGSTYVECPKLSYSECGKEICTVEYKVASTDTGCSILSNSLAISNGLTATIKFDTNEASRTITSATPNRLNGIVSVNYCYEIPVDTITVCPAGKAC